MNKDQARTMLINLINELQLKHKERETLWTCVQVLEKLEPVKKEQLDPVKKEEAVKYTTESKQH